MLAPLATLLESTHRVLLTTHEHPDADGLGAMLALAHYLHDRGKATRIVVTPGVPPFLTFLDPESRIETFEPQDHHADLASWPDTWMVVDASEVHRLGKMEGAFRASNAVKVCLDHHMKTTSEGFHHEFIDPTASASSELVHDLIAPRMEMNRATAEALYAGLVDDTGNFRFSNSTPKAHRMAADLLGRGVDPAATYQALYHQGRPERLRLFGRAFETLRLLADGRYGTLCVTRRDMEACGATSDDLEGLVNEPLKLRGVEVAGLFQEREDGVIKVSLRSRGRIDVNAICRSFGGGGHRLASGVRLQGPLSTALAQLDTAVLQRLNADETP